MLAGCDLKMKKELWLFTMHFPFGSGEAFLENEIPILSKRYDRVIIFPAVGNGSMRVMPLNTEVVCVPKNPYQAATLRTLATRPTLILSLLRSLIKDAPSFKALRSEWHVLRSRIAQLIYRAQCVERELIGTYEPKNVTAYVYWTHDWVTVLGLVKKRHPSFHFFSRAHGFDIFEEQSVSGWIPFRQFQLAQVDRVYCASRSGMNHLQARFPERRDLFKLSRLGTSDHGPGPFSLMGPLKIVSCSFLIPRKRVLLLVEALSLVGSPVEWTHFGSGEEEPLVLEAISRLPDHIRADLKGKLNNAEIISYYMKTPFDVFVHLSRLEGGVAVAIQEAASFGIPVIATDSGGVREIMVEETGLLLGNSPSAKEVANCLELFRAGPMFTPEFRAGVRRYWLREFNATTVYEQFVDEIENFSANEHRC